MPKKPRPQNTAARPDHQHTLSTAQQAFQTGDYNKALTLCRKLLKETPNNIDVLNLAGVISDRNKEYSGAEKYFRRAIKAAPDNPLLYCNLANTQLNGGNINGAIATCRAALELAPDHQDVLLMLGRLYIKRGDDKEAIEIFQQLLTINPKNIAALKTLEQHYRNILNGSPDNFAALVNLGNVLRLGLRFEEAKDCFLRANAINPENSDALLNLARTYYFLDMPAEAEPVYRKAIRLAPNDPSLHSNLGVVLNNMGRLSEATDAFKTAILIDPTYAQAHKLLSYARKHQEYDDDIRAMERALKLPKLDTEQKYYLNFGLGKAYEDLQEYDRAFSCYETANSLMRTTKNYRISDDERLFSAIRNAVNEEVITRFGDCGFDSKGPIFILGMPRSGTTLVEQILSRHPNVHGGGELKLLGRVIGGYFLHHFKDHFPRGMEQINCNNFEELGKQYCEMLSHYNPETTHITNKMPSNFLYVGMIRLMLPHATIIHCMRNPLDTCFSCYANGFRDGHEYTYTLEELGHYYCLYENLMNHWHNIHNIEVFDFHYESLISDQEAQTRRLLDACGLEWNDACLDFHKSDRPIMTASVNQVRNGLYNKSVQRWKHFESHLTPLIKILRNGLSDASRLS